MTLDGTNTWILRAPRQAGGVVIDPGPLDEGHLAQIAEQGPFDAILITHGHHDHVEGAARLSELLGGTPVRAADPAHCVGGEPFNNADQDEADQHEADQDEKDDEYHRSAERLKIRVLPTPGHTADSVCFLVRCGNEQVMLTGDTILGRGTTVVAKPDGDLGAYLTSLDVLTAYRKTLMLPGHGPVRSDVAAVATEYREHRRERLAQVEAALAAGADTPEKVVDLVYPEIEPLLRFAAEWSAAAQLDYLRHKNRESGTPADGLDRL
jgi:glyoxylase-like metal-dependent hydrolase (beta-lactamase superfamily II)